MNVSRTVRLGGLSAALAVGAAASLLTSASAVPAGGGSQLVTNRPDLVSARITQGSSSTPQANTTVARAQACYDADLSAMSPTSGPGDYRIEGYDQGDFVNSTAQRINVTNPRCVDIDFETTAGTVDIAASTILTDTGDSARTLAGLGTSRGSAALEGTRQAARNGGTSGPDLLSVGNFNATDRTVDYTFDEPVATADATKFRAFNSSGAAVANSGTATRVNGTVVRVGFPATVTASDLVRFAADFAAVSDLQGNNSPTGSAGAATQRPELTAAAKTGATEFELTYDRPLSVGTLANIVAYTEDGQVAYPATSSSLAGGTQTLRVVFGGTQEFADQIVGIADTGAGVNDRDGGAASTPSYVGTRSAPIAAGFTDGPDLRQVTVNTANNTATFRFDEAIDTTPGAAGHADANNDGTIDGNPPSAASLVLLDASNAQIVGSGVNSTTGTDVVVQFTGAQVASAVGAVAFEDAVCDTEDNNPVFIKGTLDSDCSPLNAVALGTATGTPPTTTTPTTTTPTTTTPSGTSGTAGTTGKTGTTPTTTTPTTTTPSTTPPTPTRAVAKSVSAKGRRIGTKQFVISGSVGLPASVTSSGLSKATVCGAPNSRVSVQTKRGSTTLSTVRVKLSRSCTYSARVTFTSTRRFGTARSLKFVARFSGNTYLAPKSAKSVTVSLAKR